MPVVRGRAESCLEQGELLPGFRYSVPLAPYEEPEPGREVRSEVIISNVILLTRSCDLEHGKSPDRFLPLIHQG
jgi:hypothetical protein